MRTVLIGIAILAVGALIFGGLITSNDGDSAIGGLRQVDSPEASAINATDHQLVWLGLAVLGILGGVVVNGAVIAGIVWALSRGVKRAEEAEEAPLDFSLLPATTGNSIGAIATRNAPVTIGLVAAILCGANFCP